MIISDETVISICNDITQKLIDFAEEELYGKGSKKYVKYRKLAKDLFKETYDTIFNMEDGINESKNTEDSIWQEWVVSEYLWQTYSPLDSIKSILSLNSNMQSRENCEKIDYIVYNSIKDGFFRYYILEYKLALLHCLLQADELWVDFRLLKTILSYGKPKSIPF